MNLFIPAACMLLLAGFFYAVLHPIFATRSAWARPLAVRSGSRWVQSPETFVCDSPCRTNQTRFALGSAAAAAAGWGGGDDSARSCRARLRRRWWFEDVAVGMGVTVEVQIFVARVAREKFKEMYSK